MWSYKRTWLPLHPAKLFDQRGVSAHFIPPHCLTLISSSHYSALNLSSSISFPQPSEPQVNVSLTSFFSFSIFTKSLFTIAISAFCLCLLSTILNPDDPHVSSILTENKLVNHLVQSKIISPISDIPKS